MRSIKVFQSAKQLIKRVKSHLDLAQKEKVLNIINDSACDFQVIDQELKSNYWKLNCIEKLKLIYLIFPCVRNFKIPVLGPDSRIRLLWDIFQILTISSILIMISIALVFDIGINQLFYRQNFFRYSILLIFTIHIFMNFNTGYYNKGVQEFNRSKILQKYLQQNLIPDLIAMTPLLYQFNTFENLQHIFFELLLFFKVFTLVRIFIRINNVAEI